MRIPWKRKPPVVRSKPQIGRAEIERVHTLIQQYQCTFMPCENPADLNFRMTCDRDHEMVGQACWEHVAKQLLGQPVHCGTCQLEHDHINPAKIEWMVRVTDITEEMPT